MTARSRKKKAKRPVSHFNEAAGIVFFAIAILTFLCLISYDANDWNLSTSTSQQTRNWIGPFGSVLADVLFQAIGAAAYLLPPIFAVLGFRYVFYSKGKTPAGKAAGLLLFVLSVSGLLTLAGFYGGISGKLLHTGFRSVLNDIGSGILFAAMMLTSVVLITKFSFSSFFESIQMASSNLTIRVTDWLSRRRQTKAETAKRGRSTGKKDTAGRRPAGSDPPPTISTGEKGGPDEGDEPGGSIEELGEKVSTIFRRLEVPEKKEAMAKARMPDTEGPEKSAKVAKGAARTAAAGAGEGENESGSVPIRPVHDTGGLSKSGPGQDAVRPARNFEDYELPRIEFLTKPTPRIEQNDRELFAIADDLTKKTREFNVTGQVKNIGLGPVVTTYEFKPDPGVKYSRVTGLVDDLCLALRAESIRIERIPGKAFVGIEVPNKERETIYLRDVIESEKFAKSTSPLTIGLGKKIDGARQIADLSKMPHLLFAGATGSGKSVGVNALIVSILYKARPDEVKFIMVDPKRLELGVYSDIPHLATPIITNPKKAAIALKWAVSEMERRYKDLAGWGVRNIDGYNDEVKRRNAIKDLDPDGNPHTKLSYVVIIIDELSDLMIVAGKEVEESITRLAQMARAVGIHLVLATQRPSVDVITGLIKANFPARISFRVSSKIDSRTIIDANGAERLLGNGDMLFLPPATSQLLRVHGAFVDEKEIRRIVEHIKRQATPEYDETITRTDDEQDEFGDLPGRRDELFGDALRTVVGAKRASTSLLQRHLRIGYGRAAAILDALVAEGFIGDMDGSKRARPVLQKAYDAVQEIEEGREY